MYIFFSSNEDFASIPSALAVFFFLFSLVRASFFQRSTNTNCGPTFSQTWNSQVLGSMLSPTMNQKHHRALDATGPKPQVSHNLLYGPTCILQRIKQPLLNKERKKSIKNPRKRKPDIPPPVFQNCGL